MPISVSQDVPVPKENTADLVPDVKDPPKWHLATISMEMPLVAGPTFEALSPEEQERVKTLYRFQGIRCRHDIRDRGIPISRQTMDIP